MESIICCNSRIVLVNIVIYVNDEMTIVVGIWFRYVVWNLVIRASQVHFY